MVKSLLFWITTPLVLFAVVSAIIYFFTTPKQNQNWTDAHAILSDIKIANDGKIAIQNIRDFKWGSDDKIHYKTMQFKRDNIVSIKAVVSHFSAISEIAHVFLIFVLDDGRELGISIEARREVDEEFSLSGGLLAKFELMYVVATPEDLLSIRKINKEKTRVYPIKVNKEKAQELFLLIAAEVNSLNQKPQLYHLFFKNCTNQIVKHVSKLTDQRYPWFFQTVAPGNTAEILYDLDLIDMPNMSFEEIQAKTVNK